MPYARPAIARALRPHGGMTYWYGATSGRRPSGMSHTSRPPPAGSRPGHPLWEDPGRPGRPGRVRRMHVAYPAGVLGAPPAPGRRVLRERRIRHILPPAALRMPGRQGQGVGRRLRVPIPGEGRPGGWPHPARGATSSGPGWRGPPPARSPSCVWARCPAATAPGHRYATPPSCTGACAAGRPRHRAGRSLRCRSTWRAPAADRAPFRGSRRGV